MGFKMLQKCRRTLVREFCVLWVSEKHDRIRNTVQKPVAVLANNPYIFRNPEAPGKTLEQIFTEAGAEKPRDWQKNIWQLGEFVVVPFQHSERGELGKVSLVPVTVALRAPDTNRLRGALVDQKFSYIPVLVPMPVYFKRLVQALAVRQIWVFFSDPDLNLPVHLFLDSDPDYGKSTNKNLKIVLKHFNLSKFTTFQYGTGTVYRTVLHI